MKRGRAIRCRLLGNGMGEGEHAREEITGGELVLLRQNMGGSMCVTWHGVQAPLVKGGADMLLHLAGDVALLHKLLTNQEMIMEQLKIIQMNLNKTGQPVQGQDPLKGDVLPLKDVAALLALEKRLREEEDLKNKMLLNGLLVNHI
ncbi:hypothetical protein E1301_Tti023766 [Triplophysa tibetana]|uniref:Uncharacterized protein n=1 Tax=Triplophysa tibetana TaxID=1572043 RepID=A0A5A9P928_9TELE|nr:hypothetical protein E1301_Tti023766 [Triplophysa tibetana]